MTNKINIEDEIIILSAGTIHKMFSYSNGSDIVALYLFYHKQCKIQETNQSWTTGSFVMKGLRWGEERFKNAKRTLRDLGLIEDIRIQGEHGKIEGWYVKLNYIKSPPTPETTPVVEPPSGYQETNALSSKNRNALSSKIKSYTEEFNKYIETSNSATATIAKNFILLGWKPKESIDNFREWVKAIAELHKASSDQMIQSSQEWYAYWLGRDDKEIKNFKTCFMNSKSLPNNKTKWQKK